MRKVPFSEFLKHFIPYLSDDTIDEIMAERELMAKKKDELGTDEYMEWLKDQGY